MMKFKLLFCLLMGLIWGAIPAISEDKLPAKPVAGESVADTCAPEAPMNGIIPFPATELFRPTYASPKEPRFHMTWIRLGLDEETFNAGWVGFGESFGLVRWPGQTADEGIQLGVSGAVFAQFNLDSDSMDLVNADYIIGFPLSYRRGNWMARARLYHQSSHLGDEFLLYPQEIGPVERINLSFETIELLAGWGSDTIRISGGPYYIIHTDTPLERWAVQGGVDILSRPVGSLNARPFFSTFLHSWEETDWDVDISLKAGLSLQSPFNPRREFQVFGVYFNGNLPFGQFYEDNAEYYGIGISFLL